MDPDKVFGNVVAALRRDPRVGEGKMFGALGLKVGEKYFAMFYKGQLVVKLPAERAVAVVTSGEGKYFDPGHGRLMKEWVVVASQHAARWLNLAGARGEAGPPWRAGQRRQPGGRRRARRRQRG